MSFTDQSRGDVFKGDRRCYQDVEVNFNKGVPSTGANPVDGEIVLPEGKELDAGEAYRTALKGGPTLKVFVTKCQGGVATFEGSR